MRLTGCRNACSETDGIKTFSRIKLPPVGLLEDTRVLICPWAFLAVSTRFLTTYEYNSGSPGRYAPRESVFKRFPSDLELPIVCEP